MVSSMEKEPGERERSRKRDLFRSGVGCLVLGGKEQRVYRKQKKAEDGGTPRVCRKNKAVKDSNGQKRSEL